MAEAARRTRTDGARDAGEPCVDDLCVVSHRLPLTYVADQGWQRSPGGLVSALGPALRGTGARWFGHVADTTPGVPRSESPRLGAIVVSAQQQRNAIEGFCNRTLWPALHGLDGNVEQLADWWIGYQELCLRAANVLAHEAPLHGRVWLHDYHFFGVPDALRRARPDLTIGVFCHTPIVAETFGSIARFRELARSMAAADFIGVQTAADAAELARCFAGAGVPEVATPAIHVDPVGIDTSQWAAYRTDPLVDALASRWRGADGQLLVGVDRLDYTKGIPHKLLAFEMLLDRGDVDPDEARLVQVAVPSRISIPIYKFLRDQVVEIARRINDTHRRVDGRPVVNIVHSQYSPREIAALYRASDLALVTPLRDGLNLVAVEHSVVNADRECELLLGVGAGAYETLGAHCHGVDANDVIALAATIRAALTHDAVRGERTRRRAAAAEELDSARWFERSMARFAAQAADINATPVAG